MPSSASLRSFRNLQRSPHLSRASQEISPSSPITLLAQDREENGAEPISLSISAQKKTTYGCHLLTTATRRWFQEELSGSWKNHCAVNQCISSLLASTCQTKIVSSGLYKCDGDRVEWRRKKTSNKNQYC